MSSFFPLPTPQRFDIPDSLIASPASISVPLHLFQLTTGTDEGGFKLGIVVQASDGQGNSPPQMFEFDTGGQGFWMNPAGSLPAPAVEDCTLKITYTSGITYLAKPTSLTVSFPEASSALSTTATVGVIGQIEGKKSFPIFDHFYGDFGAALQVFTESTQVAGPTLFTLLAQLPSPYNNGFIVDVGQFPEQGEIGERVPRRLIVGLTPELRALFPNTLAMRKSTTPYVSGQPPQSLQAYLEDIVLADLQIDGAGVKTAPSIGVVLDTGAPSTVVHIGTEVTQNFVPEQGDCLQLVPQLPIDTSPADYALLSFTVGQQLGLNAAGSTERDVLGITAGYINTGLNIFFQSPVMFDLDAGVIGFPAAPAAA